MLQDISPSEMLALEGQSQELFSEAIEALKSGRGSAPQNALGVSRLRWHADIMAEANVSLDLESLLVLHSGEKICPSELRNHRGASRTGPHRSCVHRFC